MIIDLWIAARKIVECEANAERNTAQVRRVRKQVRCAMRTGQKIVHGRQIEIMNLDASNPPSPNAAKKLLDQVAELLGIDADDAKGLNAAINSLLEAAGHNADNDNPAADGDSDGSEGDGAEGVAPTKGAPDAGAIDRKMRAGRWGCISDEKNPASIASCDVRHGPAKRK